MNADEDSMVEPWTNQVRLNVRCIFTLEKREMVQMYLDANGTIM